LNTPPQVAVEVLAQSAKRLTSNQQKPVEMVELVLALRLVVHQSRMAAVAVELQIKAQSVLVELVAVVRRLVILEYLEQQIAVAVVVVFMTPATAIRKPRDRAALVL
jgi:hypothetical protein